MTTLQRLNQRIDGQAGVYSRHHSVTWFNKVTGLNYVPNALFCASGLSQAFDAIGLGKAMGGPFIWTVAWFNWCLKSLARVSLADAKPGDICFFRFPTAGDRNTAPVNHVTTYRGRSGNSVLVKGFNEGSGGTGGVVGNAAYNKDYLVAIFRTPFKTTTPTSTPETQVTTQEEEEEEMKGLTYTKDAGKTRVYMLFNEVSGFYSEFGRGAGKGSMGGEYINPLAQNWKTGSWPSVTEGHAAALKRSLDAVRVGK